MAQAQCSQAAKDGKWGKWEPFGFAGKDLHGSTVGIYGLGRIGLAFARRCVPFGCKILYGGPNRKPGVEQELLAEYVSLDDLLARSDFVVPHCPLNDSTRGLFNIDRFKQMKKDSVFINTTRGGVVVQDDLVFALQNNIIASAGLDVMTPEPLPTDHVLFTMDNVVVTPHIGSASVGTRLRMMKMSVDHVIAGVSGGVIEHRVV